MADQLVYWIIGVGVFYLIFIQTQKDEQGRIKDESVTLDNVIEVLTTFKPDGKSKLNEGFTEATIQKHLFEHLNKHFVHVNREQGIEGVNALKIDFDIGRGKIGVEVKLARSLFKTVNLQRLVGQLDDYIENRYKGKNLIVAVVGTADEQKERVYLSNIQEKIEMLDAKYIFLKVKTTA